MGSFLFNEFQTVFGGGAISETINFMSSILDALKNVFAVGGAVSTGMTLFLGMAGLLVIIFYFMELWNLSSKDLLSFDKLVLSFVKVVFVFSVLIYSQDLIITSFDLCSSGYQYVYEQTSKISVSSDDLKISYFGQDAIPENYTAELKQPLDSVTERIIGDDIGEGEPISMKTVFESKHLFSGNMIDRLMGIVSAVFTLLIPYALCFIAKLASYIVCVSNAIQMVAYGIFSPIALAQSFDEGSRSTGITYLKKFLASGISFGVILVIMYAGQWLRTGVISWASSSLGHYISHGVLTVNASNFSTIVGNLALTVPFSVIQFGVIGAIIKCEQIAKDMLGAR